MDDFNINKIPGPPGSNTPIPSDNSTERQTIPFDDSDELPVKKPSEAPKMNVLAKPMPKPAGSAVLSTNKITGVRTFFTKLHVGAIAFLDDQITDWLSKNPGIVVKRTNITSGTVTGKQAEPSLIITVWY